jgi:hypothetical protein
MGLVIGFEALPLTYYFAQTGFLTLTLTLAKGPFSSFVGGQAAMTIIK